MQKPLKQFLELFHPLPGNHYLLVTTKCDAITEALSKLLEGVNGELNIALYDAQETPTVPVLSNVKVQHIKNFQQPFHALPRDHDLVIFKDIFHLHSNPKAILKIAYTTLANTANIVIMQKKAQ